LILQSACVIEVEEKLFKQCARIYHNRRLIQKLLLIKKAKNKMIKASIYIKMLALRKLKTLL